MQCPSAATSSEVLRDVNQVLRVAWYRFRATFGRRWGGYLAIVVLVGLVGGLAMGAIAGARRTQSSYPTFLGSTNPSDLTVAAFSPNSNHSFGSTGLTTRIAHLPGVQRVRVLAGPEIVALGSDGAPVVGAINDVTTVGSVDGELAVQDRLTAVKGRLADPGRTDEVTMTASAAELIGVHVGQVIPLGFYTSAQTEQAGFGTPEVMPRLRVRARLVGIVVFDNQVVQDDIDRAYGFMVVTPALIRRVVGLSPAAAAPVEYGLQLDRGSGVARTVEQEFIRTLPPGAAYEIHATSLVAAQVELAVKPESVALGAFGVIAGLVALVLGIQAISRQLRWGDEERRVLRALGAGPVAAAGDGLIGVLVAVLLGSALAVAVAVGLSPLAPFGPVRPVYPDLGIAFDWTVLGVGFALLVVGLGSAAAAFSYRGAPHRVSRIGSGRTRGSSITRGAEAAGVPVAGVVGVRFALEPGRGRTAVPVRSALLGTVLAVALLVATLGFSSGLHTLVSTPSLYGWNWNYMLNPSTDVPPQAIKLLNADPDVAAWSGGQLANSQIDGETVPTLVSASTHPVVTPPVLAGHGLDGEDQIVLGPATLAVLHKRVGDTVIVSYGAPDDAPVYIPPTRVRIVGSATFPAVGFSSFIADHTSMGTGALVAPGIVPQAFHRALLSPDPNLNGPEMVFVRLRPGVGATAGRANLQHVADVSDKVFAGDPNAAGNNVTVLGAQQPVQVVNYRSIGATPVVLAGGLAAGAIVALALTLVASVRHRRRDLALLKALGFTPRQLTAVVAWQATVTAAVGVIVGIPVGIILGRQLWTLFARNIDAVPDPTVPVVSVILVGIGALVFANLVAALPGRIAARTPTAFVLRAE
jgi:FtsX-like permease family